MKANFLRCFLSIYLLLLSGNLIAQNQPCNDSSYHLSYQAPFSDSLHISEQIQAKDGGRIAIGNFSFTTQYGFGMVLRFHKDGRLLWMKKIISGFSGPAIRLLTVMEDSDGSIVLTASRNGLIEPFHIYVLSPDGEIIRQKALGFSAAGMLPSTSLNCQLSLRTAPDSLLFIFWAGSESGLDPYNKFILFTTDNNLVTGSTTVLRLPVISYIPNIVNYKLQGTTLQLFGTAHFQNGCSISGDNFPVFIKITLDFSSRTVTEQKAFCAPLPGVPDTYIEYGPIPSDEPRESYRHNVFFLQDGKVVFTRSFLGVTTSPVQNRLFSISTFDASFQHIKSDYITTGNLLLKAANQELHIDSSGRRHYSFYSFPNRMLYYAVAEPTGQFILQKKLPLASDKRYPFFYRSNVTEQGAFTSFTVPLFKEEGTRHEYFKIFSKDTGAACFGTDTAFLSTVPAIATPLNWPGTFTSQTITPSAQPTAYQTVPHPFFREAICIIRNICDTLHIIAPVSVCTTAEPVRITAAKGPFCNSTVGFRFDTASVSSYSQPNDTTLLLHFNRSWTGKVYAYIKTCPEIQDSALLSVSAPHAGIDLGPDTILCPAGSYMLSLPDAFAAYRWQDGSVASTFSATDTGTYHLTVWDTCGRSYSDTLLVKSPLFSFSVRPYAQICRGDTIAMDLPVGYQSFEWLPATGVTQVSATRFILSPDVSKPYRVLATRFAGCVLTDTIEIDVKLCFNKIYFPTAFTPNGDGRNETFKPYTEGRFDEYSFTVFNRWGEAVFRTSDPAKGWDGNLRAKRQDSNVFIWLCTYRFRGQEKKTEKGTFVLLQ